MLRESRSRSYAEHPSSGMLKFSVDYWISGKLKHRPPSMLCLSPSINSG